MNIRSAVDEGRKQKALSRLLHLPVPIAFFDDIFLFIITQSRLGKRYRTNGAKQIFIDILGGILHFYAVFCNAGNVIGSMHQNDIIILSVCIIGNHQVEKLIHERLVFQTPVPQLQQKFLLSAGHLLL